MRPQLKTQLAETYSPTPKAVWQPLHSTHSSVSLRLQDGSPESMCPMQHGQQNGYCTPSAKHLHQKSVNAAAPTDEQPA